MLYILAPVFFVRIIWHWSGRESVEVDRPLKRQDSFNLESSSIPSSQISTGQKTLNDNENIIEIKDMKDLQNAADIIKSTSQSHVKSNIRDDNEKSNKFAKEIANTENAALKPENSLKLGKTSEIYYPEVSNTVEEVSSFMKGTMTSTIDSALMSLELNGTTEDYCSETSKTDTEVANHDFWRVMNSSGEANMPSELWDNSQFIVDVSPVSGNEDSFLKNSSRQGTISDTDSDGSPNRKRRSPNRRRTLGSSSGSDIALHEGAELSPMEDDQGITLTAYLL